MSVSDDYLAYLQDLMPWVSDLRSKRMFGGVGLYSDALFFAIVVDNILYLKADAKNAALYGDGGGEQFSHQRQGKTVKMGFWSVPADIQEESETLRAWVESALDAARRAKK